VNVLAEVTAGGGPGATRVRPCPSPAPARFNGSNGLSPDRAFVLEAVYEGYLLHYETPRAFKGMDPDLRLLAGDSLYALGLERLADGGDIDAVARALRPDISVRLRAGPGAGPELAEELWQATSRVLSGGGGQGAREALSKAL